MNKNTGFGIPTLLTVIFLVLKLTGNITWSWIWVLSPLWISVIASIFIALVVLAIALSNNRRQ